MVVKLSRSRSTTTATTTRTFTARFPLSWERGLLIVLLMYISMNSFVSIDPYKYMSLNDDETAIDPTAVQPWRMPRKYSTNTYAEALTETMDWNFTLDDLSNANITDLARQVFRIAFRFQKMEPKTPVNATCYPHPLPSLAKDPPSTICPTDGIGNIFTGKLFSETPRKLGHALLFSTEIDILEIHLREIHGIVDKVFLVEFVQPHSKRLGIKPLAWEAVKDEPRFAFFDKEWIVHMILDDVDAAHAPKSEKASIWWTENYQEEMRWKKIMEWNTLMNFFDPTDLIGFGDTDEIPSRDRLFRLKHCEFVQEHTSVDVGIYFPMKGADHAFRTDFSVKKHPYSLGDPTFFTWASAMSIWDPQAGTYPTRKRGKSKHHILGGMHFTQYNFFPFFHMKQLTCTECKTERWRGMLQGLQKLVLHGNWSETEASTIFLTKAEWDRRLIAIGDLPQAERDLLVIKPWFYQCNLARYSMRHGAADSRTA